MTPLHRQRRGGDSGGAVGAIGAGVGANVEGAAMKEIASALAGLVETVERAIESGDWLVDGACDPDSDLERARRVLRGLGYKVRQDAIDALREEEQP